MNSRLEPLYQVLLGLNEGVVELAPGMYNGGFNLGNIIKDSFPFLKVNSFPRLTEGVYAFGVADSIEQIQDYFEAQINNPNVDYVLGVTPVNRDLSNKGKGGGWRWRKWGPYIGVKTPTTEYLDDEPEIDSVLVYHLYEVSHAYSDSIDGSL